jgi:hypothetical protein
VSLAVVVALLQMESAVLAVQELLVAAEAVAGLQLLVAALVEGLYFILLLLHQLVLTLQAVLAVTVLRL